MKYNEVRIKQNGIEYIVWTHAEIVRKYVKEYMEKRLLGKIIVRELNRIDYSVRESTNRNTGYSRKWIYLILTLGR